MCKNGELLLVGIKRSLQKESYNKLAAKVEIDPDEFMIIFAPKRTMIAVRIIVQIPMGKKYGRCIGCLGKH